MNTPNFMFIINDFDFGSISLKADQILDILLSRKHWLFTDTTPNLRRIVPESKVLVYIAGKGRRFFCATFEIAADIEPNHLVAENEQESTLFEMFSLSVPIRNVFRFENPLHMVDIKDKVDFVSDKKNWGLFFRQSTKIISDKDFEFILKKCIENQPSPMNK